MKARIDDLIAASSIGEGLRDIEERGIDAHLADIEQETAPRKKRRKVTSPTQRCMAEIKKRGWTAGIVERFVGFPPPGHRVDFLGVIDIVAIAPAARDDMPWSRSEHPTAETVGIQASPGSVHAAHRDKILAEPRMIDWLSAPSNRLELWSFSKRGARGQRKKWTLRVESFVIVDGRVQSESDNALG